MHVFYLHGFASSAQSTKAAAVTRRLAAHGIALRCPDLNAPEFSTLTVTRMLEQIDAELDGLKRGSVALIGSSLGGFVALHAAARHPPQASRTPVDRLILLAPALDFGVNRMGDLGEEGIARWRETDRLEVFHHGFGKTMTIGYALYADAQRYDTRALALSLPILVFQGLRDTVVDPAVVRAFARQRPNVTLRLLDDDHQLLGSLDRIVRESEAFLGLSHQQMPR
jgi:pimeloyl-ACP methyl ester carboxylesterase